MFDIIGVPRNTELLCSDQDERHYVGCSPGDIVNTETVSETVGAPLTQVKLRRDVQIETGNTERPWRYLAVSFVSVTQTVSAVQPYQDWLIYV